MNSLMLPRGRFRKEQSLPKLEKSSHSLSSSFSSSKSKYSEHEAIDHITFLSKRIQDLETIITQKNQEIHKLEMMNKQLVSGLHKRDEIISSALYENRKLKETLSWCQRIMNQSQLNPEHLNASKGNQEHYRLERKISKISNFQTFKRSESSKLDEENNSILKIMEAASEDTNLYTEKFFTLETHLQREVLAYLLRKKSEFNKLINLSLKLKRSFRACRKFSEAVLLDQLIEAFLSETKDILDCDRAVIYMVDELNKELWTRSSKNDGSRIRISLDKGVAGYCAMTGASVNIVDAYKDPRFDSSFDTRENYKTKTILSLPLRDLHNNIICVVQALNKIDGIFTPDDEALFELLSAHCVIVLQRVIKNETINLTLNRLRLSLEACVRMSKCDSLVEFSREMQRECKFVMNTDQAYFYYVDADQLCIVKDDTIEKFPLNMGLVGKSAKEGCLMNIKDAYNNPCFNGKVDIDTTLPVLCIPFKKETGEVIAVIEMLNTKSIRVQASISESKLNQVDSEIFEYFERIVTIFLNRYLYSNKP